MDFATYVAACVLCFVGGAYIATREHLKEIKEADDLWRRCGKLLDAKHADWLSVSANLAEEKRITSLQVAEIDAKDARIAKLELEIKELRRPVMTFKDWGDSEKIKESAD